MAQSLAEAAAAYCAIRERERAVVKGMKKCERIRYIIGFENQRETEWGWEDDPIYHEPEEVNPGGGMCSRTTVEYESRYPDEAPDYGRLDESDWCQSCQDNMPAVRELRAVRKRIGGYASAMFRAYRRERDDG